MLSVVPEGLIGLGPDAELEVVLDAGLEDSERLLELLWVDSSPALISEITGLVAAEAHELVERMEAVGAITRNPPPPPQSGAPLVESILRLDAGLGLPDLIWTAEEALLVPAGLETARERRLMRAFIGGIEPRFRRIAYGHAAHWLRHTVRGDAPDAETLGSALESNDLDPSLIHVLDLKARSSASLSPADLDRLGPNDTHRLGPVTRVTRLALDGAPADLHLMLARSSEANLAHPQSTDHSSWGRGIASSREKAETIARAEAVERYAAGDLHGRPIVRAAASELDGAVPADLLFRLNSRQYRESDSFERFDPDVAYLWTPAAGIDGSRRWVLAEQVFMPFQDFERPTPVGLASSSGLAAHPDAGEARRRAFRELIERDAFMWTWIQRVSRERIDVRSLPEHIHDRLRSLSRHGHHGEFVNLTLETEPVILCVLSGPDSLVVGAGCDPRALRAVEKSLHEATSLLLAPGELARIAPQEVREPLEHMVLYRTGYADVARFLSSSQDVVELGDVKGGDFALEVGLTSLGEKPITVELSCPASRPFFVVRALVPGLVPISFGWDQEPLGMPRLSEPRTTADGRTLGAFLDLTTAGPLVPHPFA